MVQSKANGCNGQEGVQQTDVMVQSKANGCNGPEGVQQTDVMAHSPVGRVSEVRLICLEKLFCTAVASAPLYM
jgi:hypothetical protein